MNNKSNGNHREEDLVEIEAVSILYEVVRSWVNDLLSFLRERDGAPPLAIAEKISQETGVSLDRVFNHLHRRWGDILEDVSEIFDEAELFIDERREEGLDREEEERDIEFFE